RPFLNSISVRLSKGKNPDRFATHQGNFCKIDGQSTFRCFVLLRPSPPTRIARRRTYMTDVGGAPDTMHSGKSVFNRYLGDVADHRLNHGSPDPMDDHGVGVYGRLLAIKLHPWL